MILNEIVRLGKLLYSQKIRNEVGSVNMGKYLVIDILTGNYCIGASHLEAAHCVRTNNPNGVFFGMRVGYPTFGKI